MLTKLLKREFKLCLNYYVYCFAISGSLSLLIMYIFSSRETISSSLSILFFLILMINGFVTFSVQLMPLVRTWRGFYGQEAFFTMSLPASPSQQILAKVLVPAAFITFHSLIYLTMFVALFMRLLVLTDLEANISSSLILDRVFSYVQLDPVWAILIYILSFVIMGLVQAMLLTYITVRGHSGRMAGWPVGGTILTYIVFVIIYSLILMGSIFVWPIYLNFSDKLEILTDQRIWQIFTTSDESFILPLVPYLASIPLAGLLFWRTKTLIAKKYELRN